MKNKMINGYNKIFNKAIPNIYYSPGRVNLIGEHIDYNGGYVMPAALSYGTYGAVSKRKDNLVKVYSEGYSKAIYTFSIDNLEKDSKNRWVDYIKGVFSIMLKNGYKIDKGLNLYIKSTLPTGAGLSSSSSLELLVIVILNDYFKLNISNKDMAIIGKDVENKFIGVNSGIMDQFSIITGKKDHAILLNTQNLEFEYIPLKLNDYQLIIANTNKKRGLADSKYNERFSECMEALNILKPIYNIEDLCSLPINKLTEAKRHLSNIVGKRLEHVVTEQDRTIRSMEALNKNDIVSFAKLMTKSHNSLRDNYDVTGKELDTLVKEALNAGAIGARMTGAGFGGCIVALVKKELVNDFTNDVKVQYTKKIGYKPSFYLVEPSDGTSRI